MSSFLFLNPWLLAALITLPALWFLLRIMPPVPKRIFLPSARFLEGLLPKTQTPSKTPWWILLLRLMIAALVITALAQPVLNPSKALQGSNAIRIIIDNGWSSAHIWDEKIKSAEDVLTQASRQNLSVYLHTTAPDPSSNAPLALGPLSANEALSRLKGLEPLPWKSDFKTLNQNIKNTIDPIDSYYFSDGIDASHVEVFIDKINKDGDVFIRAPEAENLPLSISRGNDMDGAPSFNIHAPPTITTGTPVTIQAQGLSGDIVGIENINLDTTKTKVTFDLPESLQRNLSRVRIIERNSAASVYLLGDQFQTKNVGIASPVSEEEATPFIEASFYLTRALEPYADLRVDTIDALLGASLSMIILPDTGALSPSQLERLESWVRDGGLLLRFAGSAMEQARQHFLTPTPLRKGARSLDGTLTWESPPKLLEFNEASPLAGIEIREDIIIKQQLLAEPSADLASKTWAALDDGTPLITADALDNGMIVMVHTAASPDWSNLPLSGAFVHILSRIVKTAGTAPSSIQTASGPLEPQRILDGYGRLGKPEAHVKTITAGDFETLQISPAHPPGIYAHSNNQRVLNLGDNLPALRPLPDFGSGVSVSSYGVSYETNLMPPLLLAALIILLIDWAVMIALSSNFKLRRATAMAVVGVMLSIPAHAEAPKEFQYADGLYLGFIKTSNASLNAQTRQGLEALRENLARRTSAEPDGVVALDAEKDILSFFPLIYWPIDAGDKALSDEALRNIQGYLDHGGTILFDTREHSSRANQDALARITNGLNIPALAPIKDDHVLGRSFYLLDSFPGRYVGGTIWVESNSENGRDGVSSVLIGSHDWAGAWAQSTGRDYRSGTAARQREFAMRFGVNVMMYALTGNYKADQVHVKHILERLGQ